ncbi:MAG: hypothetical protein ABJA10_02995, partial [Aestuariivirga sp.]
GMGKQLKIAEQFSDISEIELTVFDRSILMHHTMDDAGLATEVLALFEAQLQRLENLDWAKLDLPFEMHTLRGAAAAVGAVQLEGLASHWHDFDPHLLRDFKLAAKAFRRVAG